MSTPTALRGPCDWGDKAGIPAANGGHLSCCLLLAHPLNGGYIANSGSGNTSTSVCVCVCVCVVCVCVRVCVVKLDTTMYC